MYYMSNTKHTHVKFPSKTEMFHTPGSTLCFSSLHFTIHFGNVFRSEYRENHIYDKKEKKQKQKSQQSVLV